MVWNIVKQQRANWLSILNTFGKDTQLVLLQEAQTTLVRYATSNYSAASGRSGTCIDLPATLFRRL